MADTDGIWNYIEEKWHLTKCDTVPCWLPVLWMKILSSDFNFSIRLFDGLGSPYISYLFLSTSMPMGLLESPCENPLTPLQNQLAKINKKYNK